MSKRKVNPENIRSENVDTKIDIAILQTKVEEIFSKVKNIEVNHLPHIYAKLEKIDNKIAYYSGALAIIIIIGEIILHFSK